MITRLIHAVGMRADPLNTDKVDFSVSEAEGAVLGLIARRQPMTRYQLLRAFQISPFTGLNSSKGSLYPLVGRLCARGLVVSEPGTSARGTEVLRLTTRGYEALCAWVKALLPQHMLGYDPLIFRALSLGELSRQERIMWVASAKELVWTKKEELAAYRPLVKLPYGDIIHAADDASLEAQLQWLDRLLAAILSEDEAQTRSHYAWDPD